MAKSREGESKSEYKKQGLYEKRNSEVWFANYGPQKFTENVQCPS